MRDHLSGANTGARAPCVLNRTVGNEVARRPQRSSSDLAMVVDQCGPQPVCDGVEGV